MYTATETVHLATLGHEGAQFAIADAYAAVANDTRNSYPELTDTEAIAHVVNTVSADDIDDTDQLSLDYLLVIAQEAAR